MGKHSAWTTYRSTDPNRKPKPQEQVSSFPSFKASDRNVERWLVEECAVCRGEFEAGQIVCEVGNQFVHARCI